MKKILTEEETKVKKLYDKERYLLNKEKIDKQVANYRSNNLEKVIKTNKKCREKRYKNNSEKYKEYAKNYREINPEKVKKSVEKWKSNNKEKIKEYVRKRHISNPHIKAWRAMLTNCLIRMNKQKEGHTIDLLGYSAIDLKYHIETLFTDGMTWDNYGQWHVDHIKRVCEFDKDTHPSIVNALSNLRPLWATTREINGVIYEGNLNRG